MHFTLSARIRRVVIATLYVGLALGFASLAVSTYEAFTGAPEWRAGARLAATLRALGGVVNAVALLVIVPKLLPPAQPVSRGRTLLVAGLFAVAFALLLASVRFTGVTE